MRTRTYLILWTALAISVVLIVVLAGCSSEPKEFEYVLSATAKANAKYDATPAGSSNSRKSTGGVSNTGHNVATVYANMTATVMSSASPTPHSLRTNNAVVKSSTGSDPTAKAIAKSILATQNAPKSKTSYSLEDVPIWDFPYPSGANLCLVTYANVRTYPTCQNYIDGLLNVKIDTDWIPSRDALIDQIVRFTNYQEQVIQNRVALMPLALKEVRSGSRKHLMKSWDCSWGYPNNRDPFDSPWTKWNDQVSNAPDDLHPYIVDFHVNDCSRLYELANRTTELEYLLAPALR